MTGLANLRALYGVPPDRIDALADLVRAEAGDLLDGPCVARCDELLRILADTATAVRRFRTQLERGQV